MPAYIVADLGFGDSGKGSMVDFLVRQHNAATVVRFNGGAQAAHNVALPDGRHHVFAQFGSGTFVPGVRTHLSRFMLVDPVALWQEDLHLQAVGVFDAFNRLSIDERAPVVTCFQRAANRLRELARGCGRHGSCGMGIGETMADLLTHEQIVLRAGDFRNVHVMREKLRALQHLTRRQMARLDLPTTRQTDHEMRCLLDPRAPAEFADLFFNVGSRCAIVPSSRPVLQGNASVVLEGAQGVLLDEWFGFHPFTTWSTTTFANALTLLEENGYSGKVVKVGVLRAYMTRHGPGPFVTEDTRMTAQIPDMHNRMNAWQCGFRVGWCDLVMLRYALQVAGGVDQLAVTCVDRLREMGTAKICRGYAHTPAEYFDGNRLRAAKQPDLPYQTRLTEFLATCRPVYEAISADTLPARISEALQTPVSVTSHGPTFQDKQRHTAMRGPGLGR